MQIGVRWQKWEHKNGSRAVLLEVTNDMATSHGATSAAAVAALLHLIPYGLAGSPAVKKFNHTQVAGQRTVGKAEKTDNL